MGCVILLKKSGVHEDSAQPFFFLFCGWTKEAQAVLNNMCRHEMRSAFAPDAQETFDNPATCLFVKDHIVLLGASLSALMPKEKAM